MDLPTDHGRPGPRSARPGQLPATPDSLRPGDLPARPWPRERRERRLWVWNLTSLIAIIGSLFCLSGCAQLNASVDGLEPAALLSDVLSDRPEPTGAYLPSTSARVFGRCWSATYEEVSVWDSWLGEDYVPCSEEHTTYTFATEDLPDELVEQIESASSDAATLAIEDDIDEAVAKICDPAFSALFPTLTDRQILLTWFSFLPSDAEWEDGARWVRCDVAVYALTTARTHATPTDGDPQARGAASTPVDVSSEPQLLVLPESIHDLAASISQRPASFEYCLDDPEAKAEARPDASSTLVTVDCDDSPLWTYLGQELISAPLGSPYPGDASVIEAARTACTSASEFLGEGEGWDFLYYPDEPRWNEGSRTVQCWASA
jgi:hypothetical protein